MDDRVGVVATVHVAEEVGHGLRRRPRPSRPRTIEQLDEHTVVGCGGVRGELHERAGDGGVVESTGNRQRLGRRRERDRDVGQRIDHGDGERQPRFERLDLPPARRLQKRLDPTPW